MASNNESIKQKLETDLRVTPVKGKRWTPARADNADITISNTTTSTMNDIKLTDYIPVHISKPKKPLKYGRKNPKKKSTPKKPTIPKEPKPITPSKRGPNKTDRTFILRNASSDDDGLISSDESDSDGFIDIDNKKQSNQTTTTTTTRRKTRRFGNTSSNDEKSDADYSGSDHAVSTQTKSRDKFTRKVKSNSFDRTIASQKLSQLNDNGLIMDDITMLDDINTTNDTHKQGIDLLTLNEALHIKKIPRSPHVEMLYPSTLPSHLQSFLPVNNVPLKTSTRRLDAVGLGPTHTSNGPKLFNNNDEDAIERVLTAMNLEYEPIELTSTSQIDGVNATQNDITTSLIQSVAMGPEKTTLFQFLKPIHESNSTARQARGGNTTTTTTTTSRRGGAGAAAMAGSGTGLKASRSDGIGATDGFQTNVHELPFPIKSIRQSTELVTKLQQIEWEYTQIVQLEQEYKYKYALWLELRKRHRLYWQKVTLIRQKFINFHSYRRFYINHTNNPSKVYQSSDKRAKKNISKKKKEQDDGYYQQAVEEYLADPANNRTGNYIPVAARKILEARAIELKNQNADRDDDDGDDDGDDDDDGDSSVFSGDSEDYSSSDDTSTENDSDNNNDDNGKDDQNDDNDKDEDDDDSEEDFETQLVTQHRKRKRKGIKRTFCGRSKRVRRVLKIGEHTVRKFYADRSRPSTINSVTNPLYVIKIKKINWKKLYFEELQRAYKDVFGINDINNINSKNNLEDDATENDFSNDLYMKKMLKWSKNGVFMNGKCVPIHSVTSSPPTSEDTERVLLTEQPNLSQKLTKLRINQHRLRMSKLWDQGRVFTSVDPAMIQTAKNTLLAQKQTIIEQIGIYSHAMTPDGMVPIDKSFPLHYYKQYYTQLVLEQYLRMIKTYKEGLWDEKFVQIQMATYQSLQNQLQIGSNNADTLNSQEKNNDEKFTKQDLGQSYRNMLGMSYEHAHALLKPSSTVYYQLLHKTHPLPTIGTQTNQVDTITTLNNTTNTQPSSHNSHSITVKTTTYQPNPSQKHHMRVLTDSYLEAYVLYTQFSSLSTHTNISSYVQRWVQMASFTLYTSLTRTISQSMSKSTSSNPSSLVSSLVNRTTVFLSQYHQEQIRIRQKVTHSIGIINAMTRLHHVMTLLGVILGNNDYLDEIVGDLNKYASSLAPKLPSNDNNINTAHQNSSNNTKKHSNARNNAKNNHAKTNVNTFAELNSEALPLVSDLSVTQEKFILDDNHTDAALVFVQQFDRIPTKDGDQSMTNENENADNYEEEPVLGQDWPIFEEQHSIPKVNDILQSFINKTTIPCHNLVTMTQISLITRYVYLIKDFYGVHNDILALDKLTPTPIPSPLSSHPQDIIQLHELIYQMQPVLPCAIQLSVESENNDANKDASAHIATTTKSDTHFTQPTLRKIAAQCQEFYNRYISQYETRFGAVENTNNINTAAPHFNHQSTTKTSTTTATTTTATLPQDGRSVLDIYHLQYNPQHYQKNNSTNKSFNPDLNPLYEVMYAHAHLPMAQTNKLLRVRTVADPIDWYDTSLLEQRTPVVVTNPKPSRGTFRSYPLFGPVFNIIQSIETPSKYTDGVEPDPELVPPLNRDVDLSLKSKYNSNIRNDTATTPSAPQHQPSVTNTTTSAVPNTISPFSLVNDEVNNTTKASIFTPKPQKMEFFQFVLYLTNINYSIFTRLLRNHIQSMDCITKSFPIEFALYPAKLQYEHLLYSLFPDTNSKKAETTKPLPTMSDNTNQNTDNSDIPLYSVSDHRSAFGYDPLRVQDLTMLPSISNITFPKYPHLSHINNKSIKYAKNNQKESNDPITTSQFFATYDLPRNMIVIIPNPLYIQARQQKLNLTRDQSLSTQNQSQQSHNSPNSTRPAFVDIVIPPYTTPTIAIETNANLVYTLMSYNKHISPLRGQRTNSLSSIGLVNHANDSTGQTHNSQSNSLTPIILPFQIPEARQTSNLAHAYLRLHNQYLYHQYPGLQLHHKETWFHQLQQHAPAIQTLFHINTASFSNTIPNSSVLASYAYNLLVELATTSIPSSWLFQILFKYRRRFRIESQLQHIAQQYGIGDVYDWLSQQKIFIYLDVEEQKIQNGEAIDDLMAKEQNTTNDGFDPTANKGFNQFSHLATDSVRKSDTTGGYLDFSNYIDPSATEYFPPKTSQYYGAVTSKKNSNAFVPLQNYDVTDSDYNDDSDRVDVNNHESRISKRTRHMMGDYSTDSDEFEEDYDEDHDDMGMLAVNSPHRSGVKMPSEGDDEEQSSSDDSEVGQKSQRKSQSNQDSKQQAPIMSGEELAARNEQINIEINIYRDMSRTGSDLIGNGVGVGQTLALKRSQRYVHDQFKPYEGYRYKIDPSLVLHDTKEPKKINAASAQDIPQLDQEYILKSEIINSAFQTRQNDVRKSFSKHLPTSNEFDYLSVITEKTTSIPAKLDIDANIWQLYQLRLNEYSSLLKHVGPSGPVSNDNSPQYSTFYNHNNNLFNSLSTQVDSGINTSNGAAEWALPTFSFAQKSSKSTVYQFINSTLFSQYGTFIFPPQHVLLSLIPLSQLGLVLDKIVTELISNSFFLHLWDALPDISHISSNNNNNINASTTYTTTPNPADKNNESNKCSVLSPFSLGKTITLPKLFVLISAWSRSWQSQNTLNSVAHVILHHFQQQSSFFIQNNLQLYYERYSQEYQIQLDTFHTLYPSALTEKKLFEASHHMDYSHVAHKIPTKMSKLEFAQYFTSKHQQFIIPSLMSTMTGPEKLQLMALIHPIVTTQLQFYTPSLLVSGPESILDSKITTDRHNLISVLPKMLITAKSTYDQLLTTRHLEGHYTTPPQNHLGTMQNAVNGVNASVLAPKILSNLIQLVHPISFNNPTSHGINNTNNTTTPPNQIIFFLQYAPHALGSGALQSVYTTFTVLQPILSPPRSIIFSKTALDVHQYQDFAVSDVVKRSLNCHYPQLSIPFHFPMLSSPQPATKVQNQISFLLQKTLMLLLYPTPTNTNNIDSKGDLNTNKITLHSGQMLHVLENCMKLMLKLSKQEIFDHVNATKTPHATQQLTSQLSFIEKMCLLVFNPNKLIQTTQDNATELIQSFTCPVSDIKTPFASQLAQTVMSNDEDLLNNHGNKIIKPTIPNPQSNQFGPTSDRNNNKTDMITSSCSMRQYYYQLSLSMAQLKFLTIQLHNNFLTDQSTCQCFNTLETPRMDNVSITNALMDKPLALIQNPLFITPNLTDNGQVCPLHDSKSAIIGKKKGTKSSTKETKMSQLGQQLDEINSQSKLARFGNNLVILQPSKSVLCLGGNHLDKKSDGDSNEQFSSLHTNPSHINTLSVQQRPCLCSQSDNEMNNLVSDNEYQITYGYRPLPQWYETAYQSFLFYPLLPHLPALLASLSNGQMKQIYELQSTSTMLNLLKLQHKQVEQKLFLLASAEERYQLNQINAAPKFDADNNNNSLLGIVKKSKTEGKVNKPSPNPSPLLSNITQSYLTGTIPSNALPNDYSTHLITPCAQMHLMTSIQKCDMHLASLDILHMIYHIAGVDVAITTGLPPELVPNSDDIFGFDGIIRDELEEGENTHRIPNDNFNLQNTPHNLRLKSKILQQIIRSMTPIDQLQAHAETTLSHLHKERQYYHTNSKDSILQNNGVMGDVTLVSKYTALSEYRTVDNVSNNTQSVFNDYQFTPVLTPNSEPSLFNHITCRDEHPRTQIELYENNNYLSSTINMLDPFQNQHQNPLSPIINATLTSINFSSPHLMNPNTTSYTPFEANVTQQTSVKSGVKTKSGIDMLKYNFKPRAVLTVMYYNLLVGVNSLSFQQIEQILQLLVQLCNEMTFPTHLNPFLIDSNKQSTLDESTQSSPVNPRTLHLGSVMAQPLQHKVPLFISTLLIATLHFATKLANLSHYHEKIHHNTSKCPDKTRLDIAGADFTIISAVLRKQLDHCVYTLLVFFYDFIFTPVHQIPLGDFITHDGMVQRTTLMNYYKKKLFFTPYPHLVQNNYDYDALSQTVKNTTDAALCTDGQECSNTTKGTKRGKSAKSSPPNTNTADDQIVCLSQPMTCVDKIDDINPVSSRKPQSKKITTQFSSQILSPQYLHSYRELISPFITVKSINDQMSANVISSLRAYTFYTGTHHGAESRKAFRPIHHVHRGLGLGVPVEQLPDHTIVSMPGPKLEKQGPKRKNVILVNNPTKIQPSRFHDHFDKEQMGMQRLIDHLDMYNDYYGESVDQRKLYQSKTHFNDADELSDEYDYENHQYNPIHPAEELDKYRSFGYTRFKQYPSSSIQHPSHLKSILPKQLDIDLYPKCEYSQWEDMMSDEERSGYPWGTRHDKADNLNFMPEDQNWYPQFDEILNQDLDVMNTITSNNSTIDHKVYSRTVPKVPLPPPPTLPPLHEYQMDIDYSKHFHSLSLGLEDHIFEENVINHNGNFSQKIPLYSTSLPHMDDEIASNYSPLAAPPLLPLPSVDEHIPHVIRRQRYYIPWKTIERLRSLNEPINGNVDSWDRLKLKQDEFVYEHQINRSLLKYLRIDHQREFPRFHQFKVRLPPLLYENTLETKLNRLLLPAMQYGLSQLQNRVVLDNPNIFTPSIPVPMHPHKRDVSAPFNDTGVKKPNSTLSKTAQLSTPSDLSGLSHPLPPPATLPSIDDEDGEEENDVDIQPEARGRGRPPGSFKKRKRQPQALIGDSSVQLLQEHDNGDVEIQQSRGRGRPRKNAHYEKGTAQLITTTTKPTKVKEPVVVSPPRPRVTRSRTTPTPAIMTSPFAEEESSSESNSGGDDNGELMNDTTNSEEENQVENGRSSDEEDEPRQRKRRYHKSQHITTNKIEQEDSDTADFAQLIAKRENHIKKINLTDATPSPLSGLYSTTHVPSPPGLIDPLKPFVDFNHLLDSILSQIHLDLLPSRTQPFLNYIDDATTTPTDGCTLAELGQILARVEVDLDENVPDPVLLFRILEHIKHPNINANDLYILFTQSISRHVQILNATTLPQLDHSALKLLSNSGKVGNPFPIDGDNDEDDDNDEDNEGDSDDNDGTKVNSDDNFDENETMNVLSRRGLKTKNNKKSRGLHPKKSIDNKTKQSTRFDDDRSAEDDSEHSSDDGFIVDSSSEDNIVDSSDEEDVIINTRRRRTSLAQKKQLQSETSTDGDDDTSDQVSDEEIVKTPPNRGRVRKSIIAQADEADAKSESCDDEVLPKPRGRPKKMIQKDDADQKEVLPVLKSRGRPRKSIEEIVEQSDLGENEILPATKPRGRPRKSIEKIVENKLAEKEESLMPKSRGRPKKTEPVTKSQDAEVAVEMVPLKRGRPKKPNQTDANVDTIDETIEEDSLLKTMPKKNDKKSAIKPTNRRSSRHMKDITDDSSSSSSESDTSSSDDEPVVRSTRRTTRRGPLPPPAQLPALRDDVEDDNTTHRRKSQRVKNTPSTTIKKFSYNMHSGDEDSDSAVKSSDDSDDSDGFDPQPSNKSTTTKKQTKKKEAGSKPTVKLVNKKNQKATKKHAPLISQEEVLEDDSEVNSDSLFSSSEDSITASSSSSDVEVDIHIPQNHQKHKNINQNTKLNKHKKNKSSQYSTSNILLDSDGGDDDGGDDDGDDYDGDDENPFAVKKTTSKVTASQMTSMMKGKGLDVFSTFTQDVVQFLAHQDNLKRFQLAIHQLVMAGLVYIKHSTKHGFSVHKRFIGY